MDIFQIQSQVRVRVQAHERQKACKGEKNSSILNKFTGYVYVPSTLGNLDSAYDVR